MIGIFSKTTDSNLVESIGQTGIDFIIFDQEHGPITNETLYNHVRSAKLSGLKPIVRVSSNNHHLIGSALDTGADGVQIPNISSYEEAKFAIQSARFHPIGDRGVCRFVRAANYGMLNKKKYFTSSNSKLLILQVEGEKGINEIDKILELEGFDILFIGPYDLSQSLGVPGDIENPKVLDLIKKVSEKIQNSGKVFGTFTDTISLAKQMKNMGCKYIAHSVDLNIFAQSLLTLENKINE